MIIVKNDFDYEFVTIASNLRLFDENSYQKRYMPAEGIALEPGVYIVHWPPGITERRYDESATYIGPFASLAEARASIATARQNAAPDDAKLTRHTSPPNDSLSRRAGPTTAPLEKHESHEFVVLWEMH